MVLVNFFFTFNCKKYHIGWFWFKSERMWEAEASKVLFRWLKYIIRYMMSSSYTECQMLGSQTAFVPGNVERNLVLNHISFLELNCSTKKAQRAQLLLDSHITTEWFRCIYEYIYTYIYILWHMLIRRNIQ